MNDAKETLYKNDAVISVVQADDKPCVAAIFYNAHRINEYKKTKFNLNESLPLGCGIHALASGAKHPCLALRLSCAVSLSFLTIHL